MAEINAARLQQKLAEDQPAPLLLDVREDWEVAIASIQGSRHIPMQQVPQRLDELDAEQETVVICHHGMRSQRVADYLEQQGFTRVLNLSGGVDDWARRVDPSMPVY